MPTNKFSLSWIKLREPFDSVSRSDLLISKYNEKEYNFKNILDLGGGNGSFLRWCHSKNIIYDNLLIADHDQALLNNFYSITSKYLSKESIDLIKINTLSYKFKRKCSEKESYITLKKQDLLNSMELIKDYDIISLSAVSDLLSKNYIKNLFEKTGKGKIIYFSICFDGRVQWKNKSRYDKYIISMFNQHQKQEKTLGMALGLDSIRVIKDISFRKGLEMHIADSSWVLNTDSKYSIDFQIAFLNTIYKPLKNYELVDQDILKEWFQLKVQDIALKKSNIVVGHKDLLIIT